MCNDWRYVSGHSVLIAWCWAYLNKLNDENKLFAGKRKYLAIVGHFAVQAVDMHSFWQLTCLPCPILPCFSHLRFDLTSAKIGIPPSLAQGLATLVLRESDLTGYS